jgi:hypothetical protein
MVPESPTPQHQDNPLATLVDRIGWTAAQTTRYLFPDQKPRNIHRWITGARRLPDEHIPFIAYLLAISTKRAESKGELQAWLLSADADGVSIIERLRNGEVIEDET